MAKFKSPNILSHLTEKCYSCYSKLPNIRFFDYLCKSRYLEIDCICEGGYEILQYTAGKHIGKEARAKWDFYLDDDQLLPIEGGSKRAMCVKFWRKRDFESLAEWVCQKYKFIDVQKCL